MTSEQDLYERQGLERFGFMGWIAAKELVRDLIPARVQGVYLAYRVEDQDPFFLQRSDAGSHKGRDPTIPVAELENAWIPESHVLYIGKAHLTASSDLQRRVWAFVRQGRGRKAGHWGGRAAWQLANCGALLIAWKPTEEDARKVERHLLSAFVDTFGRLPFANMVS